MYAAIARPRTLRREAGARVVTGAVGIIANPAAGKDIRRLIAHASPTSDAAKIGVVRRAVVGALSVGVRRVVVAPDRHNISARAVEELAGPIDVLDEPVHGWSGDSVTMAERMRAEHVDVVIVLGGDGTHRDVAKGWRNAPMVAVSTGTNNVFPRLVDATLAGIAAGAVAVGAVPLRDVSHQATVAHVRFTDGSNDDLALVDLALTSDRFTGSRAVWDASTLRDIVACIAEPATVGLSAIAGLLHPVDRATPGGVHVRLGEANTASGTRGVVRAPVAPGAFTDVAYSSVAPVSIGQCVRLDGPGVLAFDGERDRSLDAGVSAYVHLRADGPRVIDVDRAVAAASRAGLFNVAAASEAAT